MPIYEYECTQCGAVEEAIQKFSDQPLTTCSKCSGKLQKLISQSSFHLKGTGWYVTDYKNGAKKSTVTPETGGSGSDAKKTEKKKSTSSEG